MLFRLVDWLSEMYFLPISKIICYVLLFIYPQRNGESTICVGVKRLFVRASALLGRLHLGETDNLKTGAVNYR